MDSFIKMLSSHSIFDQDQSATIVDTLHEELHGFIHTEVTGWGIRGYLQRSSLVGLPLCSYTEGMNTKIELYSK
jgi:hypothetical protein